MLIAGDDVGLEPDIIADSIKRFIEVQVDLFLRIFVEPFIELADYRFYRIFIRRPESKKSGQYGKKQNEPDWFFFS